MKKSRETKNNRLKLSEKDSELFTKALLQDPPIAPTQVLKEAVERYKNNK